MDHCYWSDGQHIESMLMVTLLPEHSAHSHLNPILITPSMVGVDENCSRPQRNNLVFCAMFVLCCCSVIFRTQSEFRFLFENMFVYEWIRWATHYKIRNVLLISVNSNSRFKFSPYRAVNTLRFGYTNQSVNAV